MIILYTVSFILSLTRSLIDDPEFAYSDQIQGFRRIKNTMNTSRSSRSGIVFSSCLWEFFVFSLVFLDVIKLNSCNIHVLVNKAGLIVNIVFNSLYWGLARIHGVFFLCVCVIRSRRIPAIVYFRKRDVTHSVKDEFRKINKLKSQDAIYENGITSSCLSKFS